MEVMDTILALREKCVEDGQGPMPEQKKFAENVKAYHNIYGNKHEQRLDWLPENVKLSAEADTAYFAGCTTAYQHPDIASNTVKTMQAAGIPFKVMGSDEYCCGAQLWRTGQATEARKLAEHNMTAMKKSGIRNLIVSCAECYGTFKGFYPRIGEFAVNVLHITEVLEKSLAEGRLKLSKTVNLKAVYHDPCLLGRLSEKYIPWKGEIQAFGLHVPPKKFNRGTNGVYDAPRKVLQSIPGIELVEMVRNAENSFCCGGGGGVPAAFPDFSLWTAKERLNEAVSTGAEALVSACPLCANNFQNAIAAGKSKLRYCDITELIAKAI
jgi:Fe-S oxidoreductase